MAAGSALAAPRPAHLLHRDQRLADAKFRDPLFDIKGGVVWKALLCGAQRLAVARGVGAQRVQHPLAKLAENVVGDVLGVLADEPHAHAFGPDEPRELLHPIDQRARVAVKQQMGLVEKEHQAWFVGIADLRAQPEKS